MRHRIHAEERQGTSGTVRNAFFQFWPARAEIKKINRFARDGISQAGNPSRSPPTTDRFQNCIVDATSTPDGWPSKARMAGNAPDIGAGFFDRLKVPCSAAQFANLLGKENPFRTRQDVVTAMQASGVASNTRQRASSFRAVALVNIKG